MLLGTCSGISDDNLFRARRQPTQVDQIMSLPAHALGPSKPSAFGNHKAARAAFWCADYKYGNDRRQASRYQAHPSPNGGMQESARGMVPGPILIHPTTALLGIGACIPVWKKKVALSPGKFPWSPAPDAALAPPSPACSPRWGRARFSPGALMPPWTKPHKPFDRLAAAPRYCRVMLPTWVPYSRSLPRWRKPSAGWISWSITPALAASAVRFTSCRPRPGTRYPAGRRFSPP